MDISVHVSTGSLNSQPSMGLPPTPTKSEPPVVVPAQSNQLPVANNQINLSTTPTVPSNLSNASGSSQNTNNVNVNVGSQPENKPADWTTTFISSLKSLFETFTSTITKLLESWFGNKPSTTAAGSSTPPPSTKPGVEAPPARQLETFGQRTTKNLGSLASGTVNEEQMQEAVVMYQLYQKDEELESVFKSKLTEAKGQGKIGDAAIKTALIESEKTGKLARWESDWVYSLSYRAAQFDNDGSNLGTTAGSAVVFNQALQTAERNLVSISTGAEKPITRSVA